MIYQKSNIISPLKSITYNNSQPKLVGYFFYQIKNHQLPSQAIGGKKEKKKKERSVGITQR